MIYLYLLFIIAEAVFAVLFIKAGYPESTKKGFCFKMIASSVFVLNGLLSYRMSSHGGSSIYLMSGLALGLFGDIFLTFDPFIRNRQSKRLSTFFIVLGGLFFLAGHVFYMLAFLQKLRADSALDVTVFCISALSVVVGFALVLLLLKVKLGKFAVPVLIYAVVISCMFAMSACLALKVYRGSPQLQILLFAAPLLFIISDSSLVLKFFDKERFDTLTLRSVNLGTYFCAQMLFGYIIYYI